MGKHGGYLFCLYGEKRTSRLIDRIEAFKSFTDVISGPDLQPRGVAMCFLALEGEAISHAALMRRGQKGATAKYLIKFFEFVKFFEPIEFNEIENDIEERFRHHFIRFSGDYISHIPQSSWLALVSSVKRLRPQEADELDSLEKTLLHDSHSNFSVRGFDIVAEEKDAVDLALSIFEIDREQNLSNLTSFANSEPAPFLSKLTKSKLLEDTMIIHDSSIFGDGWKQIQPSYIGTAEFQKDNGEKLTIMNVNRTDIEHTLGVDLLYYHHRFRSFVMVQYKRMTMEGDTKTEEVVYRPTDKSFKVEIDKMREFEVLYHDSSEVLNTDAYRLHPSPFYFKLCNSVNFKPYSTELIKGMYLPLDYIEVLTKSSEAKGQRGGLIITYDNVGRYINNTLFIQLVQSGWIGSRLENTDILTRLIAYSLENGKSVIAAHSSN